MEQHLENSIPGPREAPSASTIFQEVENAWGIQRSIEASRASSDTSLFSSSLPVIPHEKLNFFDLQYNKQSLEGGFPREDGSEDTLGDITTSLTGSMLPGDEDELLAGIMDDFDLGDLPTQLEDLEDDLFESGGGMEMDFDSQEALQFGLSTLSMSDGVPLIGIGRHELPNGGATVVGEHPYGEHPSRTLFVRNINSNVEDSELRSLFEEYGEIRNLYTACKHRGFVMISYYDIRHARAAMRELQNKPLRRRKLDIHFSIPKDNPSEKDINQGTLVVFNLDASISSDDLRQIFAAYGEVKEIRETPHKRHHKFIEFYDVRAAEMALKTLNGSEIAGKRIKLEHSRPGGTRRSLIQQLSQELEQDESRAFWHHVGSPVVNSPPGSWTHLSSPGERSSQQGFSWSSGMGTLSPVNSNHLSGLASILPAHLSNPVKIAPIGKDQGRRDSLVKSTQGLDYQQSRSFPEHKTNTSPGNASSLVDSQFNPYSIGTLSGPQFLWGSPTTYSDHQSSSSWRASSVGLFAPTQQGQVYASPSQHGTFLGSHHHVGSAPSGIPLDRHFTSYPESSERAFMGPLVFNGVGSMVSNGRDMTNLSAHGSSIGPASPGDVLGSGSPISRMTSFPNNGFFGNGSYQGRGASNEGSIERSRSRRVDYSVNQIGNKQYQLDLDKIISGEDTRTTLMIKNIPNKYTSKMLLAAIDETHKGTYDFVYLPIDFKNKCNVGYAFINMVSPSHIISFYEAFNGKKWEKFNSEKVASLAYARIQGKVALITHFQNSSLMNEDKWCRPILFQSEAQENDNQVAEGDFPLTAAKGMEMTKYKELDPAVRRLVILKALCEIRADQHDVVAYINDAVRNKNELSTFQKHSIGEDGKGTSYWCDGNEIIGFRLYKEVKTFKKNATTPTISCQWETLATNLEEFQKVVDEFSSSKSNLEVDVSVAVEAEVIPVLTKIYKKKQRALQKKKNKERVINNFVRSGTMRSCRSRRPISYTFDEYDKAINEAIRETKAPFPTTI